MKNLLNFEEFLNESNDLIKTQGLCKNAMFQIEKEVKKVYDILKDQGFIEDLKLKVNPYNFGYELDIKQKPTKKIMEKEFAHISDFIYNNTSFYAMPSTFFDNRLELKQSAEIEFKTLYIEGRDKTNFYRVKVSSKAEYTKAIKEYTEGIIIGLQEFTKLLK